MKILHIYPKNDEVIRQHVQLIVDSLREHADIRMVDTYSDFKQHLQTQEPNILHCHGCWNAIIARAAYAAIRQGARIIITPHGQMEPWIVGQQAVHEKLSKQLLWQKRLLNRAYVIITMGKLEKDNFQKIGWNNRIEEIHNAVTTNTITPVEMCRQLFEVYQRVMDSNTIEQLDDLSRAALSTILKAGTTGDSRWCASTDTVSRPLEIDWRRLFVYADHENIRNYVDYGISILGIPTPDSVEHYTGAYFPDSYTLPRSLKDLVGEYEGNETNYIVKIIRQIHRQPLLLHMIELARELMHDNVNDDQLAEALEENHLLSYTRSLMQVIAEQTQIDEGYMPVKPLDNRQTQQIRNLLTNHLKI
ncbi:MAG: glycosyltransferase [Prevotella sp.]|nr:glycosyltransferase [Prevotella sp.]